MNVKLTNYTKNPVSAIEEAASNCYDSKPSSDGKIMRNCFLSGHHSVLEFADFTYHIEGVSRALLAQITRHRLASFAVRSQRYCSEDGFEYITPPTIRSNKDAMAEYQQFIEICRSTYYYLQSLGIPNEDARFVLPNSCETVIEVKMNGRELMHFFNERLCSRAQWEIRQLANLMLKELKNTDKECYEFSKLCGPKCEMYGKELAFCPESRGTCGRHPSRKEVINAISLVDKTE